LGSGAGEVRRFCVRLRLEDAGPMEPKKKTVFRRRWRARLAAAGGDVR